MPLISLRYCRTNKKKNGFMNELQEYHLTLYLKGQVIDTSFYSTRANIKEMATPEVIKELKSNSTYSNEFLDTIDNIKIMSGFVPS